jgi:hypothetical protein
MPTDIETILRKALSSDRFAFDYSKTWRFLSLTPEEHRSLLKHFNLPAPTAKLVSRRRAKRKET